MPSKDARTPKDPATRPRRSQRLRGFPERNGAMVLFVAGIAVGIGVVVATAFGHDPVAVAALPTAAALIAASAYYSRVRKLPGVELADLIEQGGSFQAPPDATPTEAVQQFAATVASNAASLEDLRDDRVRLTDSSYFIHVRERIPQGMVGRATWEGTSAFAHHLESQGWRVEHEVPAGDGRRRIDLVAEREGEVLLIEVKGVLYAMNPAIVREIVDSFPSPEHIPQGATVRRALFLPTPPLAVSPDALDDFRSHDLELWYAERGRFVRAA
jgi:hypothetical protein